MERSPGLPDYIQAPDDAAGIYMIWPGDGLPEDTKDWDWREQTMPRPWDEKRDPTTFNVTIPTLTHFAPEPGTANGTSLIIAPGGAFHFLTIDNEGNDMARRLAARGVDCFVLRYRLGRTPDDADGLIAFRDTLGENLPVPGPEDAMLKKSEMIESARHFSEADGAQAVAYLRANAEAFGIDPKRVGICGFSAGGAVTLGAVMAQSPAAVPDFAAPIYAAILDEPSVPANAPPLFIVVANDDDLVPPIGSTRLYEAWHAAGVSAELHVFATGSHGFGMREQGALSDAWYGLFEAWLNARGLI